MKYIDHSTNCDVTVEYNHWIVQFSVEYNAAVAFDNEIKTELRFIVY